MLCVRIWRYGFGMVCGNRALERKRIRAPTALGSRDIALEPMQLIHENVELVLYFFQTVFCATHDALSSPDTEMSSEPREEQN